MTLQLHRLTAVVAMISFVGCERGCLTSWFEKRGGTPTAPGAPATMGSGGLTLSGIDCSDGLARCTGGMVEVSLAYHYPDPCHGPEERCRCPWERVDECPQGCAADGVEQVLSRELAGSQLCAVRAEDAEKIARPLTLDAGPPPPGICGLASEPGYRCAGSLIVACGPSPRQVAVCARGCAREGEAVEEEGVALAGAIAILCRR